MSAKRFSAIVPVAGTGTRLKPHTNTYPKVLLTVGDKPIIGHILDQLLEVGTPSICMVVGYMGEKIKAYVGKNYPALDITYVEQQEPKGLGHAIWLTSKQITGPVFILLGDTILSADMKKFTTFEEDCIGVKAVDDPRRFGVVKTDADGYVTTMVEKPERPESNLAIVGAYSFTDSAKLFRALEQHVASGKTTKGEIQFTDAMMAMVRAGDKIKTVQIDGWYDCGKPETLLSTNRYLLELKKEKFAEERGGNLIIPPSYIAPTAVVANSIIGPHASIGDGAEITSSIVANSIINEHAFIKNTMLTDSLIGPRAALVGRKQQINIGENSEIYFDSAEERESGE